MSSIWRNKSKKLESFQNKHVLIKVSAKIESVYENIVKIGIKDEEGVLNRSIQTDEDWI